MHTCQGGNKEGAHTVDGKPVPDQVTERFETHPSITLEIGYDIPAEEPLVSVFESLRKIPVE